MWIGFRNNDSWLVAHCGLSTIVAPISNNPKIVWYPETKGTELIRWFQLHGACGHEPKGLGGGYKDLPSSCIKWVFLPLAWPLSLCCWLWAFLPLPPKGLVGVINNNWSHSPTLFLISYWKMLAFNIKKKETYLKYSAFTIEISTV